MNRRELLRLMSMAGTLVAASGIEDRLDWERLDDVARRTDRIDSATVEQYAALSGRLWKAYTSSNSKVATFPSVRKQLGLLVEGLQRSSGPETHQRLCALVADLLQLAGEILFDCNQYMELFPCSVIGGRA